MEFDVETFNFEKITETLRHFGSTPTRLSSLVLPGYIRKMQSGIKINENKNWLLRVTLTFMEEVHEVGENWCRSRDEWVQLERALLSSCVDDGRQNGRDN